MCLLHVHVSTCIYFLLLFPHVVCTFAPMPFHSWSSFVMAIPGMAFSLLSYFSELFPSQQATSLWLFGFCSLSLAVQHILTQQYTFLILFHTRMYTVHEHAFYTRLQVLMEELGHCIHAVAGDDHIIFHTMLTKLMLIG